MSILIRFDHHHTFPKRREDSPQSTLSILTTPCSQTSQAPRTTLFSSRPSRSAPLCRLYSTFALKHSSTQAMSCFGRLVVDVAHWSMFGRATTPLLLLLLLLLLLQQQQQQQQPPSLIAFVARMRRSVLADCQ